MSVGGSHLPLQGQLQCRNHRISPQACGGQAGLQCCPHAHMQLAPARGLHKGLEADVVRKEGGARHAQQQAEQQRARLLRLVALGAWVPTVCVSVE